MTSRGTTHSTMQASIPMSLFASWDIDRSSANCIPRVCSVNVTRLVVLHELDKDCQSVFVAAKMQHSKRILRSNEIDFLGNSSASLNTNLELIFSIQYPHFVKRDQNRLQLLLQRRKRYKNRAMLGYKTLAMAVVDMEELIQCPRNDESILQLYSTNKDAPTETSVVAQIFVKSLSSLPLNIDPDGYRLEKNNGADRSPDVDNYSEDDVDSYSDDIDGASDNIPEYGDDVVGQKLKSRRRKIRMSTSSRQQNFIKTKVTAILRKFKQGLGEEIAQQSELPGDDPDVNLDFLYDELEDFNTSDSCPDLDDTVSVVSTPKPKLRPFFDRTSHSSSQTELNNLKYKSTLTLHSESNFPATETETSMERTNSASRDSNLSDNEDEISSTISNASDRKHHHQIPMTSSSYNNSINKESKKELKDLSESLKEAFTDDKLPRMVVIADASDKFAVQIATYIYVQPPSSHSDDVNVFLTRSFTEIRSVFSTLLNRLQTNVNSSSTSFSPVKILVVGAESFFNQILRQYVERMSGRSPDLQNLVVFYIVPYANHAISRHLTSVDSKYSSNFNDHLWRDGALLEQRSNTNIQNILDISDDSERTLQMANRVKHYINDAKDVLQVCISEVMLTFRQAGNGDEGPSQKFIPFVSDVKVGVNDSPSSTFDSDREDGLVLATNSPSMQPISQPNVPLSPSSSTTVANSPTVLSSLSNSGNNQSLLQHMSGSGSEIKLGLQVDYWKDRDQNKFTLKSNFKSFLVSCQHSCGSEQSSTSQLVLDVVTKGKKNLMRLPGKKPKERESESKSQEIGSISRLICASKHQHTVLRVTIDSVEWKDVKFFQISSTWSSHIKTLPVAIFSFS